MSKIELEVRPQRDVVVSGEALTVDTLIRNQGDTPLVLPGRLELSDFVYNLGLRGEEPTVMLSGKQMAVGSAKGSILLPEVTNPESVPPGGETTRKEEIASYCREPLTAGEYHLSVAQQLPSGPISSKRVNLTVEAPRLIDFSSRSCPWLEMRVSVFAHREEQGGVTIFQRESRVHSPMYSVYYRRLKFEAEESADATSVAACVKGPGMHMPGMWFAWLGPKGLTAHYADGSDMYPTVGPEETSLDAARVLPVGIETGNKVALFFVLGGREGNGYLRTYKAEGESLELLWEAPFGPAIPDRVSVHLNSSKEEPRLTLVWMDASGGKPAIVALDYDLQGNRFADAPRIVARLSGPLVALDLAPTDLRGVPNAPRPPLHVLTGPDPEKKMTYRRIHLDDREEASPIVFLPPPGSPLGWVISADSPEIVVVAHVGSQLLAKRAAAKDWQVASGRAPAVAHLQVYSLDGEEYYLEWVDPAAGFRLDVFQLPE